AWTITFDPYQIVSSDEAASYITRKRIPRSFALATKEVTVREFREFLRDQPAIARNFLDIDKLPPEAPMTGITWLEATQYCRWLSRKEGIAEAQWCYPALAEWKKGERFSPVLAAGTVGLLGASPIAGPLPAVAGLALGRVGESMELPADH